MGVQDLDWMGWCVIITICVALIIMGGDWVGPDIIFTMLVAFYMAAGILTPAKASLNYGNTGLLTVVKLYMVAEGIYQTGGLESVMTRILGRSRSAFWALVRIMIPTMVLSAFLNNTPVVALLTPIIISWARRSGVPVKKLLIPLSYAAVLGGTCTLIGTSTNLVVSGAQAQRYAAGGAPQFGIFDIAPYGVPYAIWGFLFILAVQSFLLPGNSSKYARNILIAARPFPASPLIGKTIVDTGLNKIHDTPIVGLLRNGVYITDVSPLTIVHETDVFYFAGEIENVVVAAEELGFNVVNSDNEEGGYSVVDSLINPVVSKVYSLLQVTITPESPLIGSTVREAKLRAAYDITVVGVQRGRKGHKDTKLNDIVIHAGDILLIDQGATTSTQSKEWHQAFQDVHVVIDSKANLFVAAYRISSKEVAEKTVSEAGLRGMPGIHVLALDRNSDPAQRLEPVDHHTTSQVGDTIWIAADLPGFTFLSKFPGLELATQKQIDRTGTNILDQELCQLVVAANSPLVGRSVVDIRFRQKYKAAVVAYQREGHVEPVDIRHLVIQPGDVLLVNASTKWADNNKANKSFVLINRVENSSPPKRNRALIAIGLGIAMVLTQIIPGVRGDAEWINLWPAASLTAGLMMLFGCFSGDQARKSILWDVFLCIAAAFGASNAMEGTGVAREFAQIFIDIANAIGTEGAGLTAVYIATALLSEILTNNAAGAIMYPIAAIAADQLGIAPNKMSIAIMLGASAGFINPFSYQCNLMVYVAGNYRTLEFAKIGAPFQVYLLIVAAFVLNFMDSWHVVWIVSFVVAGAVIIPPAIWAYLPARLTLPVEESFERFWARTFHKKGKASQGTALQIARTDSGLNAASRSSSIDNGKRVPK